ncbi:MAG: ATP-binding cassette domain-containing protein, partial [Clostridia bacterium]|nr:ATP-binding cassette domain-containing protein [Clostridia bacterium]
MDAYKIEGLKFKYEGESEYAINDISLTVKRGDFVLLCGKSGCGKSTLLRLLKPVLSPIGEEGGSISFFEKPLKQLTEKDAAAQIGFVSQNPDNQIICDDVFGELCFGMSQLGCDKNYMGKRVFEVANYFGISHLLNMDIQALSGGQKQLLTVAGVLCTAPSVLLLDEPTSGLDANSATLLISALERLNRELGITIIAAEQNLDLIYPVCNKVALMEKSRLSLIEKKERVAAKILNHEHREAFPVYVKAYGQIDGGESCPKNMNEAKEWINAFKGDYHISLPFKREFKEPVLTCSNLWLRMEKNGADILKGISLTLNKGEIACVLGAIGSGKSTLLKALT